MKQVTCVKLRFAERILGPEPFGTGYADRPCIETVLSVPCGKAAFGSTMAARAWADETSSMGSLGERIEADVCSNEAVGSPTFGSEGESFPTVPPPLPRVGPVVNPAARRVPGFWLPRAVRLPRLGPNGARQPLLLRPGQAPNVRAASEALQWACFRAWLLTHGVHQMPAILAIMLVAYVRAMLSLQPQDLQLLDGLRTSLLHQWRYLRRMPFWIWRLLAVRRI